MRKPLVIQVELDVEALRHELHALETDGEHDALSAARAAELEALLAERERELAALQQRAAGLEEREATLSERERNLTNLAQRVAELDQREAELAKRERDANDLARIVAERERAAERRDAGVPAEPSMDLEEQFRVEEELDQRRARLEAEIELRWDDIDRREEELDGREQTVVRKEQELVAYVSQVQDELIRRERSWLERVGRQPG